MQARKAVAESDYVSARPALAAALEAGGRGPDELADLYRLTGIVEAALGDARAATEAFSRLLALSPRAALPAGTSPKIKRPFDAAARLVEGHALEVKIETAARPPAITLVVVSDPLNMIANVRAVFTVDGGPELTRDVAVTQGLGVGQGQGQGQGVGSSAGQGPRATPARGASAAERTEIALPAGRRIDARIAALDRHGNHLAEIGSKEVPIVIIGEEAPQVAAPSPPARHAPVAVHAAARPIYLRWWPYAAASVAFLGAAGYFAWSVHTDTGELDRLNADSVHHAFGEARAVEDRARRDLLFTNIGLGVAGACALAAGAMYLTTPRDRAEARLAAVPVRGGGAVVLGGTF